MIIATDDIAEIVDRKESIDVCLLDSGSLDVFAASGRHAIIVEILNGGEAFEAGAERRAIATLERDASDKAHKEALRSILAAGGLLERQTNGTAERGGDLRSAGVGAAMFTDGPETRLEQLLTPRQSQVLACLKNGDQNIAIAHRLGISESTVRLHVSAILRALKVSNRTAAVAVAEKLGRARPDEEAGESYA
jgi:DNA-binding NarL/FixJ family response regulator